MMHVPVICDVIDKLKNLPNVRLPGEKPYRELPGYLRQFAVCTLPFRMNRLTRSVDPVKVYEYLSQGKPVVSTPLPDLAHISELLYFAESPEQSATQIDRALAESDKSLPSKRMSFASQNTWQSRVETLNCSVQARFPPVSILLAPHASGQSIKPCLDSIRRNTAYPNYEVIVVDASAAMAKGEYLVFLNPDTIVTWGWLERLLRLLQSDPAIGLAAPVSNSSCRYESIAELDKFAFQRSIDKWGQSTPIDRAPLCCCILPRKVCSQAGEPRDEDVPRRVKAAGYRMMAAEDCFVHSGSGISFSEEGGPGGP